MTGRRNMPVYVIKGCDPDDTCMTWACLCPGNFFPWLDNLQPVFYDHFVLYLTEVVRWYHDTHGITFRCTYNSPKPQTLDPESCRPCLSCVTSPSATFLVQSLMPFMMAVRPLEVHGACAPCAMSAAQVW